MGDGWEAGALGGLAFAQRQAAAARGPAPWQAAEPGATPCSSPHPTHPALPPAALPRVRGAHVGAGGAARGRAAALLPAGARPVHCSSLALLLAVLLWLRGTRTHVHTQVLRSPLPPHPHSPRPRLLPALFPPAVRPVPPAGRVRRHAAHVPRGAGLAALPAQPRGQGREPRRGPAPQLALPLLARPPAERRGAVAAQPGPAGAAAAGRPEPAGVARAASAG